MSLPVPTKEVIRSVYTELPESAARPLAEWMTAMRADLKALLAKLDADPTIAATDFASTIKNTGD